MNPDNVIEQWIAKKSAVSILGADGIHLQVSDLVWERVQENDAGWVSSLG